MNQQSLNLLVHEIEKHISLYQILDFQFQNMRWKVIPLRIVFLEGELGLIGQSLTDGCLVKFPLKDLLNCSLSWHKLDYNCKEKISNHDIDNFISGIRLILEVEMRLILKIYNLHEFKIDVPYHFFRNPTMVTNSYGDYIWASHIEPSHIIFDWIYSLGSNVEILDPLEFKKIYLNYLENLLLPDVA